MYTKLKNHERIFKAAFSGEIVVILLVSAIKWFVYQQYLSNLCQNRPIVLRWKSTSFCVNSLEKNLWNALDLILIAAVVTFIITALLAIYVKTNEDKSNR